MSTKCNLALVTFENNLAYINQEAEVVTDYEYISKTTFKKISVFSDPDIVNGVYWSEALNKVFVDNFEKDPSLIWQYFGSAKGFFRQYPGKQCVCKGCLLVMVLMFYFYRLLEKKMFK